MLSFDERGTMTVGERIPGGYVFVDGAGVGDIGPAVLRDREMLARDGVVVVNVLVDSQTRELLKEPEIVSRGFVFLRDAEELIENAKETIRRTVGQNANGTTQNLVQDALSRMFYNETKRRPMIFVFVNEI
jgi:ribonuclease J